MLPETDKQVTFDVDLLINQVGIGFVKSVQELQHLMLSNMPDDLDCGHSIQHFFAHGTYVRQMSAKKGAFIIGKTHRYEHICNVISGSAIVFSEYGNEIVQAPYTFVAEKGIKRVFYVLEDLIFQNVHPAHTENLEELESDLIVNELDEKSFNEFRKLNGLEY